MLPRNNTGAQMAVVAPAHSIVTRGDAGQPVTTSTAIAAGTEVQHKNVLELVRRYLADLEKFGLVPFKTEARLDGAHGGGAVYAVLNEQQATLLIAFMRNSTVVVDFKVALVRSFYEMRAALAGGAIAAPTTMREALMLALAQEEKIEQQAAKISADAPKVEFAETIRALDGVCKVEDIAKTIGIGRNKLFKQMRSDKVLMAGTNLPYQKYIDREYFTVVEQEPYVDSKGVSHPTFATRVTGAGQVFLVRKYGAHPANIAEKEAA